MIDIDHQSTSGLQCNPISMVNVHNFFELFRNKKDIVSCGGVYTVEDI